MKLLYVAQIRLPTRKAHGVQIMNMCAAFANQGAIVELLIPRWQPSEEGESFDYYGVRRNFIITRLFSPRLSIFGSIGFIIETIFFGFRASFYSLMSDADIIYSRNLLPLLLTGLFANKESVWETHAKIQSRWSKFLVALAKKNGIKIVTITKALKLDLVEKYNIDPRTVLIAHDGVDLSQYSLFPDRGEIRKELNLPQDKFIVSYVGRYRTMGQEKGVDGLIEAFGIAKNRLEDALLLLVGIHEGEKPDVLKLLERFFVTNYKIVPVVPANKVPRYLSASDVLVMNYPLNDHYAHFMSPLKMFEYMASNRPIVSSNLPSIREVLNPYNAVLVEPDNPKALSDGIVSISKDKAEAEVLAEQAFKDVHNYTWNNRADKILLFINKPNQNEN